MSELTWKKWDDEKPADGTKVIVVCNDGCSSAPALYGDDRLFHAEDGEQLDASFTTGSIWLHLPEDYPLRFMEMPEADWR